jgi:hypothetical protein
MFLTIRHQRVNCSDYCVAHDLSSQAYLHGTLSNRGQVGVSQLVQPTNDEVFSRLYSFSMCSHLATAGSWLSKC